MISVTTRGATTLALAASLDRSSRCGAHAQSITGAGSTFAAPIYAKWGEAAHAATNVTLNYQAIGSGAGQNQVFNRTVDFDASDAPVPCGQAAREPPGAVPDRNGWRRRHRQPAGRRRPNTLKLTGDLLVAEIYLGKITKWNDPKLVELNAGPEAAEPGDRASLSRRRLGDHLRVHRLSLDRRCRPGRASVGANTSIKWPAGAGARGSDGVSRHDAQHPRRHRLCRERLRRAEPPDHHPAAATRPASSSRRRWRRSPRRPHRVRTGPRCRISRST